MGKENKLESKIFDILKMLQKMSVSEMMRFDVRDYEFRRVVAETRLESKEKSDALAADFEEYENPSNNIVVKTAIGKKWAQSGMLDFDYDASLFANCIYWLTMFQDRSAILGLLDEEKKKESEYAITCNSICYRGDTMNSWSTTLNEFCRKCGEPYIAGWNGRDTLRDPRYNKYKEWYELLSVPQNYKQDLPEYITEFMDVVYTIGNFSPLPKTLNLPRGSWAKSKDYWDLALLAIYQHYKKTEDEAYKPEFAECTLEWVFDAENEETCIKWLCSFNGWNHFVEQNFLQDFVHVDEENGGYGRPKELWNKHFECRGENATKKILPVENDEFSEFFTNASAWILARGARIAPEVKEQLENKDLHELARRMAG